MRGFTVWIIWPEPCPGENSQTKEMIWEIVAGSYHISLYPSFVKKNPFAVTILVFNDYFVKKSYDRAPVTFVISFIASSGLVINF